MEDYEKMEIANIVQDCNGSFITDLGNSGPKHWSNLREIISLPSDFSSEKFSLDDPSMGKCFQMMDLKRDATKCVNQDLQNVTKTFFEQNSSELCAPISVTSLLRHAIKKDLGYADKFPTHSFEQIFSALTMVVYPQSLAGLNLNPNKKEKEQTNEIELLLRRVCKATFLIESGWEIIRLLGGATDPKPALSTCEYEEVLLHDDFAPTRPLTVTGAFLIPNEGVFFHQMILDRVDQQTDEFLLQNRAFSHDSPVLRIPRSNAFYGTEEAMRENKSSDGEYKDGIGNAYLRYIGQKGEIRLANEKCEDTMKPNKWYLLPQAYSLTLTAKPRASQMGPRGFQTHSSPLYNTQDLFNALCGFPPRGYHGFN